MARLHRWPGAGLLLVTGVLLSRLILPAGLAGVAYWAHTNQLGLYQHISLMVGLKCILGFILFDLAVWCQHVAMHRLPLLWRFHRVHHSDPDFDVFTALRFHPGEILVSLAWKALIIIALGVPAWVALSYEIALNLNAMFNHSNLNLPRRLDQFLRWLIVTPDMHRVHHSVHADETDRNFGFCLPWWDHLSGLYTPQPRDGHEQMKIGLAQHRADKDQSLRALLVQPFDRL